MTTFETLLLTSNIVMIFAVVAGPIAAVRITRYLDDQNESRSRKRDVYKTLMATRANNLSQQHIDALNSIDLTFSQRSSSDRKVREAWKAYLDHLGAENISAEQWGIRRADLLVELLYAMGTPLGYDFDKTHIKNGIYSPRLHGEIESDQAAIRRGFKELLEARRVIPVHLINLPGAPGDVNNSPSP